MAGATCGKWVFYYAVLGYDTNIFICALDGDHQLKYGPDFFADDTDGLSRVASIAKGADWMINQLFKYSSSFHLFSRFGNSKIMEFFVGSSGMRVNP